MVGICGACLAFSVARAHAVAVGREDVPVAIWLFIWGAAAVLVASFIALSIGWRTARLEREQWRPLSQAVSQMLINPVTEVLCGAAGVGLLGVVVWSGIYGTDVAGINFSVTFVFITFWLGGVLASVLLGNVYRAFNPWRAIARLGALALTLTLGRRVAPPLSYPQRLGRWPAAAGLVAFVWMELISGAQGPGVTPRATAIAALIYMLYSLCGMALFGIEP